MDTLSTGSASLSGVVSGDTVTLDTSVASGSFADKNVGTGKSVTASGFAIGGADGGNYSLTQPTGLTADITAAGGGTPATAPSVDTAEVARILLSAGLLGHTASAAVEGQSASSQEMKEPSGSDAAQAIATGGRARQLPTDKPLRILIDPELQQGLDLPPEL